MSELVTINNEGRENASTKDKLFDPSIEMLVNDFDDERTLEEEEALAAREAEDPSVELKRLQKVIAEHYCLNILNLTCITCEVYDLYLWRFL